MKNTPPLMRINARRRVFQQTAGMEPDFTILEDGGTPLCPSCNEAMRFVRSIPRFAALPELRTYECKPCGVTYTGAVTAGDEADLAWIEQARHRGAA